MPFFSILYFFPFFLYWMFYSYLYMYFFFNSIKNIIEYYRIININIFLNNYIKFLWMKIYNKFCVKNSFFNSNKHEKYETRFQFI